MSGRAGVGKTYTVRKTLDDLGVDYRYHHGRVSAPGLADELRCYPHCPHVFDDIHTLLAEPMSQQIFLAALGVQPGKPRTVTYTTKNERREFEFNSGIIAISNKKMGKDPLSKALISRCVHVEHNPTEPQTAALMRKLANGGYNGLSPTECMEVVEVVIAASKNSSRQLDLRAMTHGFDDRLQWKHGLTIMTWQDLIKSNVQQPLDASELERPLSKQESIKLSPSLMLYGFEMTQPIDIHLETEERRYQDREEYSTSITRALEFRFRL